MLLELEKNTEGRDFVVSEIGGNFSLLKKLMSVHSFDGKRDRIFSLGGQIGDHPSSHKSEQWLSQSWFYAVKGESEAEFCAGLTRFNHGALANSNPYRLNMLKSKIDALPLRILVGDTLISHYPIWKDGLIELFGQDDDLLNFRNRFNDNIPGTKRQLDALFAKPPVSRHFVGGPYVPWISEDLVINDNTYLLTSGTCLLPTSVEFANMSMRIINDEK